MSDEPLSRFEEHACRFPTKVGHRVGNPILCGETWRDRIAAKRNYILNAREFAERQ